MKGNALFSISVMDFVLSDSGAQCNQRVVPEELELEIFTRNDEFL